jgi:hypothetical protein
MRVNKKKKNHKVQPYNLAEHLSELEFPIRHLAVVIDPGINNNQHRAVQQA